MFKRYIAIPLMFVMSKKIRVVYLTSIALALLGIIVTQGQISASTLQDPQEPNNSRDEAYSLVSGIAYSGAIADVHDRDWFTFDILQDGLLEITLTEHETTNIPDQRLELCVFNSNVNEVDCKSSRTGVHYIRALNLELGKYFAVVRPVSGDQSPNYVYRLQAFVPGHTHQVPPPGNDTAYEINDALDLAYGPLVTAQQYTGYISTAYDHDWFHWEAGPQGTIEVMLQGAPDSHLKPCLYDNQGRLIKCKDSNTSGDVHMAHNIQGSDKFHLLVWSPDWRSYSNDPYQLTVTFPVRPPTPTPTPTPFYQYMPLIWRWFDVNATATPTSTPTITPTATIAPTKTPTPTNTPTPYVKELLRDGFEDDFPGQWRIVNDSYSADSVWGKTSCRKFSGQHSVWAGVGDGIPCITNYPSNTDTWMVFGPFDLSDASAAQVNFKYRLKSEPDYDKFLFGASIDGTWFFGKEGSGGTDTWKDYTFDLSDVFILGSLLGEEQVWFGFHFESDSSINYSGVFVDEVMIQKRVGGAMTVADDGAKSRDIEAEFKDARILLQGRADQ